ncbi:MAG: dipeptide ABC transporter permease DppC, partial [Paracoccaceae bacterium]
MTLSTEIEPIAATGLRAELAEFWHYFSENRGAVLGLWVFIAVIVIAIFAPLLAPHSPIEQARDALLMPPSWQEGGDARYLLGTDAVGRDILSRLIHGARFSLFIGCVV